MKNKITPKQILILSLTAFFIVCVILPLISMFCRITPAGFANVVKSPQFAPAVANSILTALAASLISMVLAFVGAWSLERTSIRGKAVFSMLFIIPMLIPSTSHAFGLVALFGANGMLTKLLRLDISIYGFLGIVIGSVMYAFPVAFLMFSSILQYENGLPYKAAAVMGVPNYRQFRDITLPYLKKTIISVFFAVFTLVVTDYGVPLMIGGKCMTLSVLMFNRAAGMIDYNSGSVIGAFLLIPAVAAFLVDILNPDIAHSGFVTDPVPLRKSNVLDYLFSVLLSVFVIAPIAAFCMMVFETKYPIDSTFTLHHIEKTIKLGGGKYLLNSVLYAILTACLGTGIAFFCSYLTARMKGAFSKILHLVSITSMAIPGIVLGLSYVIFFHNAAFYGTMLIIIVVDTIHFFASPYLMMYNTLSKVNPNLEDVGHCLGIRRIRIIRDVILPKVKYTLMEMFAYFFVNALMTISAVSFLAPPAPKPIALMINQFEAQLLLESAAFVSLLILLVNLILKLTLAAIRSGNNA